MTVLSKYGESWDEARLVLTTRYDMDLKTFHAAGHNGSVYSVIKYIFP
jgi:hypothetical protein